MNRERLRPLGLGDIFDEGFDLYKRNFVFLLLVGLTALAPLDTAAAWLAPRLLPPIFSQFNLTSARSDAGGIWAVTSLVHLTVFLPVYALAVCPLVAAASERYLDRPATLGGLYRRFGRRLPALVATCLLGGLALALSLLGCLVAWVPVACQLFFTLPASVIEGKGPGRAIGRSGALARGDGGRVFSCLCLLGLIALVITLGLRLPLEYLFGSALNLTPAGDRLYGGGAPGAGGAEQQSIALLSSGLAHLFLAPFLTCVLTVLYYDMRIRKEGFDIETLAQGLGYPPLAALGPHLPPVPVYGVVPPNALRPGAPPPPGAYGGPRR